MIKKLVLAFTLFSFLFVQTARAAPLPSAGWSRGVSSTGQSVWFGPGYSVKTSADVGRDIWTSAVGPNTGATLTSARTLAVGAGDIAVVAKAAVTGADLFAAVKLLTMGGTGVVGVGLTALSLLPMAVNYFKTESTDLGSKLDLNSPTPFIKKTKTNQLSCRSSNWTGSPAIGSTSGVGCGESPPGTVKVEVVPVNDQEVICEVRNTCHPSVIYGYWVDQKVEGGSEYPASWDDIAPYMDRPIDPSIIKALIQAGVEPKLTGPSVTGPATTTAPPVVSTTTDGTNTTTKTSTKKDTTTYSTAPNPAGSNPTQPVPKVTSTTNTTTVTVVKNTANNTVISTVTNVENNPAAPAPTETPPEDLGTITDTPYGDIPKLYERKYPDGIKGVYEDKITAIKAAPLFTLVGSLMPTNIGSSGSCPSFMIPVNFGQWGEYGNLDFSPPCMVWDFGKVIIVISSLLLARRLIFGG